MSTEVWLSFEPRSGQTLVKLDQREFRSKQQADSFRRSWPQVVALVSERVDS